MEQNSQKQRLMQTLLIYGSYLLLILAVVLIGSSVVRYQSRDFTAEQEEAQYDLPNKQVLWLSSYSPVHDNYLEQQMGVYKVFEREHIAYDVYFMYARRHEIGVAEKVLYQEMKAFLAANHYDAMLISDDDALSFVHKYRNELFAGIPAVFFGINDFEQIDSLKNDKLITGFTEPEYIKETIEQAKQILPETKKVVGIYDDTRTGRGIAKSFFACRKNFPEMMFRGINVSNMTQEALANKLSEIEKDTILIYMLMTTDAEGNFYSVSDAANFIVDHTSVPVFRNYSGGFEQGVIGGVRMNMEESAVHSAETLLEIMSGKDPSKIPVGAEESVLKEYQYAVLTKYGLSIADFPDDCMIMDVPTDYWNMYREVLIPLLLFLVAMLGIMLSERMRLKESRRKEESLEKLTRQLKKSKEVLKYQAETDDLTGLVNRRTALMELGEGLSADMPCCIVLVDIVGFKEINETYGHSFGDEMLRKVSTELKHFSERSNCYAARYGGDEFLVVFDHHLKNGSQEIEILQEIFEAPMKIGMDDVICGCSVGAANSDGSSSEELILHADMALHEAKQRGKHNCIFFKEAMKRNIRTLSENKNELLDAITNDGLEMVYQPQISMKDLSVSGYEALIRMKNRKLSPAVFIPIAEQNGWINRIGRLTTEKVIMQIAQWRQDGRELKPVSINFSSNQMNDTGYLPYLLSLMKQYDIAPELIRIEITESMYIERTEKAKSLFERFRKAGIRLHMDDFGTGYSSLSYLSYIPVDTIKIDRSLIQTYLQKDDDTFVQDVIRLGHDVGKQILIEGVEEKWQYRRLRQLGADGIQGYYFSRPCSDEEAILYRVPEQKK